MSKNKKVNLPPDVDTARMYTDGSATYMGEAKGGWGLYVVNKDGSEKMFQGREHPTTVSRMEMIAMRTALNHIAATELKSEKVNIYSDSAMVVNSINMGWLKNWHREQYIGRLNADIWKDIYNVITTLKNVKVHHISGHLKDLDNMHVYGNNMADLLANYKDEI